MLGFYSLTNTMPDQSEAQGIVGQIEALGGKVSFFYLPGSPAESELAARLKEAERRLFYGPHLPEESQKSYCYIVVGEQRHLAMHYYQGDIMRKVGDGYEELPEVWEKDTYTFAHYLTMMEI